MSKGHVTTLPPIFHSYHLVFFKSIHYDFIDILGLSIPLGVSRGGISIRNPQVTTVSLEGFTIELKAIIRDEGTRDLEPSDNVFPNKFLGIYIPDICQGFSLNLFSEIVRAV